MLALALVLALAGGARAGCHICVSGVCHTTQTLLSGFRVTDQLAIDRHRGVLYTQLNDNLNVALDLYLHEILLLNTMRSSGMAVDPETQTLYLSTKEFKETFYKYHLSNNSTEIVLTDESVDMKRDILLDDNDKLHFISEDVRSSFENQLKNYSITDFVVTGSKIFFVSNDTVYLYNKHEASPKMIVEKKHVLSGDAYDHVYLGDATQKVIYKYIRPGKLQIHAAYAYGAVEQFVFDASGNIVFQDADGRVARWVLDPENVHARIDQSPAVPRCRVEPPHQDYFIQEISSDICKLCKR